MKPTTLERFMDKISRTDKNGCMIWAGAKTGSKGQYGGFWYEGKLQQSHRVIWTIKKGLIPKGLTIDHMCQNTLCQNTDHMELVTRGVNSNRGKGACGENLRKTHCPRNHPYDENNTRITAQGWRECKACKADKQKSERGRALAAARQARYRARKAVE